jgi:anti-sigma factor RsiW
MNECPIEIQLTAYLDGELPKDQAVSVETHLASCTSCARELSELRAVKDLARSLVTPEVSTPEWDMAWNAISERIAAPAHRASRLRSVWLAIAAAAAVLLAAGAGIWTLQPRPTHRLAVEPKNECVVDYVETSGGYSSMYSYSPDADVTIITLIPSAAPEEPPDHASGKS